jgi:hypothetical protein
MVPSGRPSMPGAATSALATVMLLVLAGTASAQSAPPAASTGTMAGYAQTPTLEGPDGVSAQLAEDDAVTGGAIESQSLRRLGAPWFAFKKRLNDQYGLQLSFSFQSLYQNANETLTGISDAAAVRGQIQGSWTFLGRGTENTSRLTFSLQNRNAVNGQIPPTQLAGQFGSVVNTGTGFNDAGFIVNEVAWRQALFDGRLKFITGVMSAISWYNTTALSSSLRGFQNTGMQSSLSKPAPGRGLGFGLGVQFSPHFVMVAGVHDANSTATENPFDTIKQHEYYKAVEFRYLPSSPDRWKWDTVKLQLWHQDALAEKGIPESSGAAVQASYLINDRFYPFTYGGWSDGKASIFKQDLVAGLGIAVDTRNRPADDAFAFAVGWGNPSIDGLQDQYTAEVFYRLQLLRSLAITPSLQVVHNPAANFEDDTVFLLGLRTRIQF